MVEEIRTPAYCAICGSKLVPSDSIQGYDPFTGDALKSSRLNCNNPTKTEISKLGMSRVETTYHPSWTQSNGVWQQS